MSTIKIQTVKFHEESKIPVDGERAGLSNVRIKGGNEAPIRHEMTYDTEARMLCITHLVNKTVPPVLVPAENIRYLEPELVEDAPQQTVTVPASKK